jgi:hypothetical protein
MFQYSFANVDLILQIYNEDKRKYVPLTVTGYPAGDQLFTIARKAPIATTQFGAYGPMVVSMQRILAGDLSFTLLMNSPDNEALQKFANYFQGQAWADGEFIKPVQATMVDNMGNDKAYLANGVVIAMPAMVRGVNMNTVTWQITFESITFERKNADGNIGVDLFDDEDDLFGIGG